MQHLSSPIPPPLLAAHVRLLTRHQPSLGSALLPPKVNSPEKILRVARKYTSRAPTNASIWLARLDAEKDFATQHADVDAAWAEARGKVEGAGLEDVWLWGLRASPPSPKHSSSSEPQPGAATAQDNDSESQVAEVELLEVRAQRDSPYAIVRGTHRDRCGPPFCRPRSLIHL